MVEILISNRSDQPIYEQVYTQIKRQIIAGSLKEGSPLPSIRQLAKDLRISVITTKRAYDELEREGFIDTIPGKGSLVAKKNAELLREMHLRQIEVHLREVRSLATLCDLNEGELQSLLQLILTEE